MAYFKVIPTRPQEAEFMVRELKKRGLAEPDIHIIPANDLHGVQIAFRQDTPDLEAQVDAYIADNSQGPSPRIASHLRANTHRPYGRAQALKLQPA